MGDENTAGKTAAATSEGGQPRRATDLDFLLNPHATAAAEPTEPGDYTIGVASPSPSNKSALSFILGDDDDEQDLSDDDGFDDGQDEEAAIFQPLAGAAAAMELNDIESRSTTPRGVGLRRKSSKFCIVEGCTSRAKHARRCWKHGGSVKCKVADCPNRAKTKGVCWSHGGGTLCSVPNCTTIAVSNGVCWAHGGGKRCVMPNCSRPAYERTQNLCTIHYEAQTSGSPP